MKYRAKITRIYSQIESIYVLNESNLVKDVKDSYIEVDTEEEAETIDRLNHLQAEFNKLYIKLLEMRGQ